MLIRKHVSENHKRTFLFSSPVESTGQQNNTKVKCCPVESTGQQNTKVKCCPVESTGQQIDTRGKYSIFLDEAGFYELVFRSKITCCKNV